MSRDFLLYGEIERPQQPRRVCLLPFDGRCEDNLKLQAINPTSAADTGAVSRKGMRLTNRLLLVVLACLIPTLTLGLFIELDQRAERKAQLDQLILRQAELLSGDMTSIALGTRGLLTAAAEFPAIRALNPSCGDRLTALKRDMPIYSFFAVLDGQGKLVCSSGAALIFPPDSAPVPSWASQALATNGFTTGGYIDSPESEADAVSFSLPLQDPDGTRRGAIVAGLDLGWLAMHLQELRTAGSPLLQRSVLSIADRNGVVLARTPRHQDFVGKRLPAPVLPLIDAPQGGATRITRIDGTQRLIGYVPATISGSGLLVTAGFFEPDLMADIKRANLRDGILLAATTLLAIVLCMLCGRRFIVRPAAQLVDVARRWRAGDLTARAEWTETRSEFGQIAAAWNEMAEALEQRAAELREQAQMLESRVAERTRALSETNNRLQVEIAEREHSEAALVQVHKLQTVGQLAGGIAHDINNLLATILGSLELIGGELDPDQERQRALVGRASQAVQRGAQLTRRLLVFSRRTPLTERATDINRLVSDLGTLLATSTLGGRIRVEMQLDPAPWPAMTEPSQAEAAILNLALNARDAMPGGGVLTITTAKEALWDDGSRNDVKPGDYVSITLRDTGEGMTDDVARRAFEPFFTTKGRAGSGLGLSQILAFCREMGGGVRMETAPGSGTAVTLLLPRAHVAPALPLLDPRPGREHRWNVLLVDDDAAVRQVTGDMLLGLGCKVRQVADGTEALAVLHEAQVGPNLLIVDYAMPGMNGLALAAAARDGGFTGPVLLATGYAEAAEPELGETVPDAVLHKPFTADELSDALFRLGRSARATTDALEPAR